MMLDVAREIRGCPRANPDILKQWWSRDVEVAVSRKRDLCWICRHSQEEEDRKEYCQDRKEYCEAK